jgi:hypothetical protein
MRRLSFFEVGKRDSDLVGGRAAIVFEVFLRMDLTGCALRDGACRRGAWTNNVRQLTSIVKKLKLD